MTCKFIIARDLVDSVINKLNLAVGFQERISLIYYVFMKLEEGKPVDEYTVINYYFID